MATFIPITDAVFRNPDMPPRCTPESAGLFYGNVEARRAAKGLCQVCPLGPYGPQGNVCLNFLDDHPEIERSGVWGGRDLGGSTQEGS
jgi:hypothetical protein